MQERVEPLRDFGELHPLRLEDLAQQVVAVDELALVRVLKSKRVFANEFGIKIERITFKWLRGHRV